MPKVELNLEDDELKELLLGDRDKAMQSIMAKILDEILKSEATEQIKAKAYAPMSINGTSFSKHSF